MAFSPLNTTGATAAWSAGAGVVWNAEVELAGSITGRVTLAESEDSYLFHVSLPGIRIDQSFSCEFDMDGEVLIEGEIATGGNTVESRTGNPCQPGHFSLRFQLPGRIYLRGANCNFRSDGTFEGRAKKQIEN
ncbi:hypothetical protein ACJRO7_031337 [Eucalyptus globulus]|uniref:SHSP domain-containing protein n=1 Tax=Eucalyptus globulus TaxID=34317 RepID=A0ABD3JQ12_EUCGL